MTPMKTYNKRNLISIIVHAATPDYDFYEDIPESIRNPYSAQHPFHTTLCGADKGYHRGTFNLTKSRPVTCKRCLKNINKMKGK